MANPKLDVDVRGNTKPLERQLNKVKSKGVNLNLDSKNFSAPLGKIKGELGEFDKSLAASNARVLAFGASAGAIFAIQRALSETVTATLQVEKALAEVNVILGTSEKKLNSFGNELFNIAKKTGRSFNDVALAAGELARQGLAMEETLRRTADAMTLARLSGLGVEASVNAITAALNGFRNAALSSTAVIDKIIAVDQAFAVSGADLAEALRRVGSTAEGAGVSLDELLGIVTAAQQITARGGAVIGNSFKTIFTRIQRPRVLKALDELGVKTRNAAGASLSATQVLKNLASTFDTLGESQQAQIAELVGGVFQINVLKASLRDLGSQYSVFANATDISSKSSGEAARRNAELNKTLSAGLNETLQNLTKLAAGIGKLTLEPAIRNVLDIVNAITEKLSLGEAEGAGQKVGKALLGGLGKFLSGPGLALAAVALFQLFNNLRKFAVDALRTFTGLNSTFKQQQQLQQGILNILKQNPKLLAQIQRGEISVEAAAEQILGTYKKMNTELLSANNLAGQLASKMVKTGAGIGKVGGATTITKRKASGYIPNFADGGEVAAMALSGMYTKSQMANPQTRRGRIHDGQGGSFMASYNGHEKKREVIGPNGKKGTIIASPEMQKALARGFIPNFAKLNASSSLSDISKSNRASDLKGLANASKGGVPLKGPKYDAARKRLKTLGKRENRRINLKGEIGFIASQLGGGGIQFSNKQAETRKFLGLRGKFKKNDPLITATPTNMPVFTPKNLKTDGKIDKGIAAGLRQPIADAILNTSKKLFSPMEKELPDSKRVEKYLNSGAGKEKLSLTAGNIFEDAINAGLNLKDKSAGRRWDYVKSDFAGKGRMLGALIGDENKSKLKRLQALEAKLTYPPSNIAETRAKFFDSGAGPTAHRAIKAAFADVIPRKKAGGFIPNFANPLGAAVKRENQAGVTKGAIRIGQDRRLATGANPYGLAVTNTRDEPRGIKDVLAKGYIPNFAKGKDGGMSGDASGKLFGIMMAASLVTSTFSAATEETTGAARKLTVGMNQAVNAAMIAGTAMMLISGPVGIVAGALAGLTIGITGYLNEMGVASAAMKANSAALSATTVALQEQGNSIQQAQQALSALSASIDTGDAQQVAAAQKTYTAALNKLSPALKAQVMGQTDKKDQADVLAKAAGKTGQRTQQSAEAAADQKAIIDALNKAAKDKNQKIVIGVLAGIAVICAAILAAQKIGKAMNKKAKFDRKTKAANAKFEMDKGRAFHKKGGGMKGMKAARKVKAPKAPKALGKGTLRMARFGSALKPLIILIAKAVAIFVAIIAIIELLPRAFKLIVDMGKGLAGWFAGLADKLGWKPLAKGFRSVQRVLGGFSRALSDAIDNLPITRFFKDRKETKKIREGLRSKYKEEGREEEGITDEGRKQLKADAANILERLDPEKMKRYDAANSPGAAMAGLRKAASGGGTHQEKEDRVIKALVNMGMAAEEAETYVRGAGDSTYALALGVSNLEQTQKAALASTNRLQAALDRAAATQAATAAAMTNSNNRANDFARMMRTLGSGIQAGRKQLASFNREFNMEVLKGGAKLASQFSSSFDNTRRQGDIKKLEINNKAAATAEKTRAKGSKDMFAAISKQKDVAALMKKADEGTANPAEAMLVNELRNLPNALSGQGAAGMLEGVRQAMLTASRPGGAIEGQKVTFEGADLGSILMDQTNKMAEAERTRQHQIRLAELQTDLQQQQNKIDQEAKAGGGISAFLDPEKANKMESNFNRSIDDFVTASSRGDSVQEGRAAGNLLSSVNDFFGGPMMGEGADALKDQMVDAQEKSLRGRALAQADVLDDTAARTGNSSLSDVANNLRNMDFRASAQTQVDKEFKRDEMPANIKEMLSVQQRIEGMQQQDNTNNFNTAKNTRDMANYLTGGKFDQALTAMVANMPAPIVGGLSTIGPQMAQAARAMHGAAAALGGAATLQMQGDRVNKLADKKKDQELALEEFVKNASKDGIDANEAGKIQTMIMEIARTNNSMSGIVDQMGPRALAAMGPEFVNALRAEQHAAASTGVLGGQNFDTEGMNAGQVALLPQTVQHALAQIQRPMEEMGNMGNEAALSGPLGIGGVGGRLGFEADRKISNAEQLEATRRISSNRNIIGNTLQTQGQGGATDVINQMIRQAQLNAKQGRAGGADVAALEIQALTKMLNTIQTTGGLSGKSNKEFIEEMITAMNNQSLNGTFVINVPNSLTGQMEAFVIEQEIELLSEQIADITANLPANTAGAPVNAPNTNN